MLHCSIFVSLHILFSGEDPDPFDFDLRIQVIIKARICIYSWFPINFLSGGYGISKESCLFVYSDYHTMEIEQDVSGIL